MLAGNSPRTGSVYESLALAGPSAMLGWLPKQLATLACLTNPEQASLRRVGSGGSAEVVRDLVGSLRRWMARMLVCRWLPPSPKGERGCSPPSRPSAAFSRMIGSPRQSQPNRHRRLIDLASRSLTLPMCAIDGGRGAAGRNPHEDQGKARCAPVPADTRI